MKLERIFLHDPWYGSIIVAICVEFGIRSKMKLKMKKDQNRKESKKAKTQIYNLFFFHIKIYFSQQLFFQRCQIRRA